MDLLRRRRLVHTLWPRQHLADSTSHQQSRMQCSVIAQTPANLSRGSFESALSPIPVSFKIKSNSQSFQYSPSHYHFHPQKALSAINESLPNLTSRAYFMATPTSRRSNLSPAEPNTMIGHRSNSGESVTDSFESG
ncbi:hypothetical protein CEXT_437351 [Caerostris extrusa]|uniref:Uncharacterized protein n=1 Tax=Caerostris extrusa TaxID=172846 RepID=A0AAV4XMY5_CAEEX|nr:hypothetical protein CEXT_437351 [Caerostris extrusa]